MTIHPRQQTTIAQAHPLILRTLFMSKRMHNITKRRGRILGQERDLPVNLIGGLQNSDTEFNMTVGREITAKSVDISLRVRLYIQEEAVVRISQYHRIFFLIAQDGDCSTMDIVTQVTTYILVRVGWLHDIDSSHQTSFLVHGVAIDNNVLDC